MAGSKRRKSRERTRGEQRERREGTERERRGDRESRERMRKCCENRKSMGRLITGREAKTVSIISGTGLEQRENMKRT
jgi:hypothetical protein